MKALGVFSIYKNFSSVYYAGVHMDSPSTCWMGPGESLHEVGSVIFSSQETHRWWHTQKTHS